MKGKADLLALLCVMFRCVFVTFPCGVLGQVWYLIVSIPDLCLLYFNKLMALFLLVCFFKLMFQIAFIVCIELCPPTLGVGDILLLVRIPSDLASASTFISVHYLLNQVMEFDQICIDT